LNIYYTFPYMAYSECSRDSNVKIDSDIQYDFSSVPDNNTSRVEEICEYRIFDGSTYTIKNLY